MSLLSSLLKLLFTHPGEFWTLVQFKLFHKAKRDLSTIHEHPASGWDRQTMWRCWEFLDLTSRSFAAVIKELDGDLALIVHCFLSLVEGIDGPCAPAHHHPIHNWAMKC
jgi:farnesyl-diphosphate farnesyltransferase